MASRLAVLSERRTEQRARLDQLVTEQTQVFSALEPEHARESLSVALSSGNDLLAKLAGVRQGIGGVARGVDERIKLETSLAAHRADADLLGRLRSELSAISVDAGLRQRHASTDSVSRQIEELRLKVEDLHRAAEAELESTAAQATVGADAEPIVAETCDTKDPYMATGHLYRNS